MMTWLRTTWLTFFLLPAIAIHPIAHADTQITTTTGMVADAVRVLTQGIDNLDIIQLMPSGVDPHLYQATQGDLKRLLNADMIVFNGLHLEANLQNAIVKVAKRTPVHAMAETLEHSHKNDLITNDQITDPHVWMAPRLWHATITPLAHFLTQHLPQYQAIIQHNARQYQQDIGELDQQIRQWMKQIPSKQRVLITAHDAFSYFGRDYGLQVESLQGLSTVSEFGLKDIHRLKQLIVQQQVPAVFVESSIPHRSVHALIEGVQQQGGHVTLGGELYSDALGEPGSAADTYLKMVAFNAHTIYTALSTQPNP